MHVLVVDSRAGSAMTSVKGNDKHISKGKASFAATRMSNIQQQLPFPFGDNCAGMRKLDAASQSE